MKLSCEDIATAVLGGPLNRSGSELVYRCPNHDDQHPSLKINTRKDCFLCGPCGASGSAWKLAAFLSHLDPRYKLAVTAWLRERRLLGNHANPHDRSNESQAARRAYHDARNSTTSDATVPALVVQTLAVPGKKIAEVYPYTDCTGRELFIKVRYEPKDFRIARPDGRRGYTFGLEGVTSVLFRLPEVERATQVVLTEGEKDVLTVEGLGFTATTKPHGVSSSIEPYVGCLRGKDVVICYDRDEAGRNGAIADGERLSGVTHSLKLISVPQGKDVSEWIEKGGTGEQLKALIDQAPDLARPALPIDDIDGCEKGTSLAPTEPRQDKCPTPSQAAWYGLSREYREIVGATTEASHNYHLACFLAATGAALARSVYIAKAGRHYPNLFVVLVGPSGGGRKSTALNLGVELLQEIDPEIGIVRSIDSREGFIEHLENLGKQQRGSGWACAMVRLAELRSLIDKTRMEGLRNIVPALCDAYDCPASLEVRTRKNALEVHNPTVSLLAATTRRWIDGLSEEDLEGGLGNRVAWVPGEPGAALPNPPQRECTRWDKFIHELCGCIKGWLEKGSTELSFSSAATARWEKIYAELYAHRNDDPLIAVLCERLQNHCLKVALIFAALDSSAVVESYHLEAANSFTQFLYDSLWYLFRGFGMSPMAQLDDKIVGAVRLAGPNGIRLPQLKKKFWRTDMETFNRRLNSLCVPGGPIECIKDGRKVIVRLANE